MYSKIGLFNFSNSNNHSSPVFSMKTSTTTTTTIQQITEINLVLTLIITLRISNHR